MCLESLCLHCSLSFQSVASQQYSEEDVISAHLLNSGRFLFHDLVQIHSEPEGKILIMGLLRLEVVEFSSQKDAPHLGCLHVLLLVWELWGLRRNYSLQANAAKIDSADQINPQNSSHILPMIQPISYVCFWCFFCQNTDLEMKFSGIIHKNKKGKEICVDSLRDE